MKDPEQRLQISLLFMRLPVFLIMMVWTIDKFINLSHAATVYEKFYSIGGLGPIVMYTLGGVEILILILFLAGYKKGYTYGAVLILHSISTLSSFKQYLAPPRRSEPVVLRGLADAGRCLTLYLMRDRERKLSVG